MKSKVFTRIAATALFAVLAIPAQIIAQETRTQTRTPHTLQSYGPRLVARWYVQLCDCHNQ